ncbi:MAG: BrnA antitoxin family protein [Stellaceae bacterium]
MKRRAASFLLERQIPVKEHSSAKKRGGGVERRRTDWSRFDAKTAEEIEADIRDDPDAAPIVDADWFASANLIIPQPKQQISIRLDQDVLEHFRQYPRYQTRINAILRAAMEHERKRGKTG